MLEKLSVLALPLIALFMFVMLIYALWPNPKPPDEPEADGAPAGDPLAPRRGAQRRR